MRSKFILFFLVCVQALHLYGQKKPARLHKLEWQLKPSVGFNIPLTTLLKGSTTDHLLEYDDHSFYWQVIAVTMFFHKHWGIEFNYQASTSGNIRKREERFSQAMQTAYNDLFYVTPSTGPSYYDDDFMGGSIERGYLGVIYRLESNRFFLYPKLALGVTSFDADYGRAYLKEKESNNVVEVYYSAGRIPRDQFTLAAATAAGYKLNKWLYFNVDVLASWYKTNITFVKTITDLNTKQSTQETTGYNKHLFGLSVGAGFIISLNK